MSDIGSKIFTALFEVVGGVFRSVDDVIEKCSRGRYLLELGGRGIATSERRTE